MSVWALAWTSSPNFLRSVLSSLSLTVPMISRMLPCSESVSAWAMRSSLRLRKFFIAILMPSGSVFSRTLATASMSTPMKSWVGT